MRHKPLLFLFFISSALSLQAQEVYNYVLANATRTVNSPTSSYTQTQIAQFKRTALIYMKKKSFEQTDSVPSAFLDTQAYYLSEYVTLFFNEIVKTKRLSADKRKERVTLFMDASVSNPLFVDDDQDTTMAFITSGAELTPFCLNTDWQKAYAAVTDELKK